MRNPAVLALSEACLPRPFAVAFSGGVDSTALLHAACEVAGSGVVALHVHHGLQNAADDFERHCQAACLALRVPLHVARVDASAALGQSPEDAARRARYAALAALARRHGIGHVALAHHADDQVETLLIALSRGAGMGGLAGMPPVMRREGITFHRPLLAIHGAALRRWAQESGLAYVDDPTNADLRHPRNAIRARVLPVLAEVLPQFRSTFARSARNAAKASMLLAELARIDLLETGIPPSLAALQALSAERMANVLRHWLWHTHDALPSEAQLEQLVRQVSACTTRGHRIELKVAGGWVRREGDVLHWYNSPPSS